MLVVREFFGTRDPLIRDPLIRDPLNINTLFAYDCNRTYILR